MLFCLLFTPNPLPLTSVFALRPFLDRLFAWQLRCVDQPHSTAINPVNKTPSVMPLLARVMSHPAAWLIWIVPLVITNPLSAQITVTELQSPYSFVNDPVGKGYFISSVNGEAETADNNGFITKLDSNGKLLNLKFIQGGKDDVTLHAPKGMALVEHVLYVADLDTLRGFDTTTGKPVMALIIRSPPTSQSEPLQSSLSDVTFDGKGHLYCSDQKANTIYRVDLATQTVSVLATDRSLAGPSGLAVHPKSGQIIAVSWEKGKISEVSPEGVVTELFSNSFFSSRFQNLRGVDFDRWGNMYVSDFTTGKVWRMSWDKRFQVIAEFLPSPGDLSIDRANNLILVPYELAHAAEMNGLETPSSAKSKQEKRTLADYGFIPPPPKPAPEGPVKK
jgi:DNA-binding beta-propeller fold protein YncE